MVWLSTTIFMPNLPRKWLSPPLLRKMRFSRRWLPIANHANLERIRHWRAKKYMWSIYCHMAWRVCLPHQRALWYTHVNSGSVACAPLCGDPLYHMLETPTFPSTILSTL